MDGDREVPILRNRVTEVQRKNISPSSTIRRKVPFEAQRDIKILPPSLPPRTKMQINKARTLKEVKIRKIGEKRNDKSKIPVGARLFRFRAAWKGAHHESVVNKGLSWSWEKTPPPHG